MHIDTINGYKVFWERPFGECGSVLVGTEVAGEACSKDEAIRIAKNWIARYQPL